MQSAQPSPKTYPNDKATRGSLGCRILIYAHKTIMVDFGVSFQVESLDPRMNPPYSMSLSDSLVTKSATALKMARASQSFDLGLSQ